MVEGRRALRARKFQSQKVERAFDARKLMKSSVIFLVPSFRPGSCGVSDYALRMARTLNAMGFVASIAYFRHNSDFGQRDVLVNQWDGKSDSSAIVAYQFVPHLAKANWLDLCQLGRIKGASHLMIHEFWRPSSIQGSLSCKFRRKIASVLERLQLQLTLWLAQPSTIATSNAYYSFELGFHGIRAQVSPMPGTIEIGEHFSVVPNEKSGSDRDSEKRGDEFLWVQLGMLGTGFWDVEQYFSELRELADGQLLRHRWVVCGNQLETDRERFELLALRYGFSDVHFTGRISSEEIDWWFQVADASVSTTDLKFYAKSTGTLVAIERNVPVYFPRNRGQVLDDPERLLFTSLSGTICQGLDYRRMRPKYCGPHSASVSGENFAKLIGLNNVDRA